MMKLTIHILLLLVLLSACNEEQTLPGSVNRLNISFADEQTRSSWNDNTDAEGGKVNYIWENSENMLTAIKHGGQQVPFYASMSAAAQYHSMTRFESVDAEQSKIKLQTMSGVKYEVSDGAYVYPVEAGDQMCCLHPITNETTVHSTSAAVQVDMPLPHTFTCSQLCNDLSSLSDYSYVYTSTTLKTVDDNNVVANASHFNSACAIIRFNITNNITSDIIITGIKMEADDGSKIFPNVLRFEDGQVAEQTDKSGYYSRLTTDINNITIPRTQCGTFYNMCFPLDGDFNHVPLQFTIDTNYLTYELHLDTDVITNHKFEAGKIYTFNFSLEEKEIRLNTIDISQCTTYNVDNEESLNIIVSPDAVWQQAGSETAQMVFVSLGMTTTIDGTDYDVLWATCNLGAMEPIETGHYYAWGEVQRKAAEKYSPKDYNSTANADIRHTNHDAVTMYLGNGHWLWCMPTQEMWKDILTHCQWTWKAVYKKDNGESSETDLDFDASVWEVTKRDANNNLVGKILLPITGYSGYDEKTGNYGQVEKALCCYWTSTPCSNVAGAQENSWAFITEYNTEVGTGLGGMTPPILQEKERYQGYAIRPVLLKQRTN